MPDPKRSKERARSTKSRGRGGRDAPNAKQNRSRSKSRGPKKSGADPKNSRSSKSKDPTISKQSRSKSKGAKQQGSRGKSVPRPAKRESRSDREKSRAKSRGRDDTRRSSPPKSRAKSRGRDASRGPSRPKSRAKSRGRTPLRHSSPPPKSRAKSRGRNASKRTSPPPLSRAKSRDKKRSSPPPLSRAKSRDAKRDIKRSSPPPTSRSKSKRPSPPPLSRAKSKEGKSRRSSPPPISSARSRGSESRSKNSSGDLLRTKSRDRDGTRSVKSGNSGKGESRGKLSTQPPRKSKPIPSEVVKKSKPKSDSSAKIPADKKKDETSPGADADQTSENLDAFILAAGDDAVNAAREEMFGFNDVVAGVSKFAEEHPELKPAALGNSWLDFVDTYIMPNVKRAGLYSDDTTCVTGTTGWETYYSSASAAVEKTPGGKNPNLSDLVKSNSTKLPAKASASPKPPKSSLRKNPFSTKSGKGKQSPTSKSGKKKHKAINDDDTIETFEL